VQASSAVAPRPGIVLEGSFFVHHSLANVNCELAIALARAGIDIGLQPFESHLFDASIDPRYAPVEERFDYRPARVDWHVRHRWPPRFARPRRGRLALIQPWEYGSVPRRWVREIEGRVDELWVPSHFVRDVFVADGVRPEKVAVIPQGVDPDVFHPHAAPLRLRTPRRFKFLFVGGSLERKGFDLLLDAYAATFTAADDVCLVIKDFFYGGDGRAAVRALRRRAHAPEVLYFYGDWPARRLAGLYTACDCAVFPFRGEGFGLPIVEAMACGLPVIVTGRGPTLDYCPAGTAYLLPADEHRVPGGWPSRLPTVRYPTWFEPDAKALRRLLRRVVGDRAAHAVGQRASAHIRSAYTWSHAAAAIIRRLSIDARPGPAAVPAPPHRAELE
jgi:glycosyltransferase involved in cell wall biosynthesis